MEDGEVVLFEASGRCSGVASACAGGAGLGGVLRGSHWTVGLKQSPIRRDGGRCVCGGVCQVVGTWRAPGEERPEWVLDMSIVRPLLDMVRPKEQPACLSTCRLYVTLGVELHREQGTCYLSLRGRAVSPNKADGWEQTVSVMLDHR